MKSNEAAKLLGIPIAEDLSQEDFDYLSKRKEQLEAYEDCEPMLVCEVLLAEYNIKVIRKEQQKVSSMPDSNQEQLDWKKDKLKTIEADLEKYMRQYNDAMDATGLRKRKLSGKEANASPLSELFLRYIKNIKLKEQRGEKVGEPSKEALELAEKKAAETGLHMDYAVKGVLPNEVRQKAINAVQYPMNVDEKKNAESLGVMVHDFLHDPVLAAACILTEVLIPEPDLPFTPVQELRLFGLWKHKFMIDSSGFGMGKTFCCAIVCALRAVLMSDRHVGILSDTFAQGKLFFDDYFDPWVKQCPIFAAQVELSTKGGYHVIHNDDGWLMYFKNNSVLKTLPPNFMNDAKRLKSESWTDFVGDEWTSWFNLGKSQHVIKGRVRRPIGHNYDEHDPIFDHHQAFSGAADYTWRACYEMLQGYEIKVKKGNKKHCVQSWNYLDLETKWRLAKYGIDEENIEEMMGDMTKDEIERLIKAHWMNDSTGYYLASEVEACRQVSASSLVAA